MNKIGVLIAVIICLLSCNRYSDKVLVKRVAEIKQIDQCNNFVICYPDDLRKKILKKDYHPYLYLRDSTDLKSLLQLVKDDNPYVKIYAFAALVKKEYKDCFSMVVENLGDKTNVEVTNADVLWSSYLGDVFLRLSLPMFTVEQKDSLKYSILRDYNHLEEVNRILLFQKKDEDLYNIIKSRALTLEDSFSLIALSRFKNPNDISTILKGFDNLTYYSGTLIFFKAIEIYPEKSFYDKLLSYSEKINTHSCVMDDFMYYYYALARYPNMQTLKLLTELCDKKNYSSTGYWESNLIHIYKAITKYNNPVYNKLIKDIGRQFSNFDEYELIKLKYDDHINNSVWNY